MMKLRIELYGRLKDAGFGEVLEIEVPERIRAGELLLILAERLGTQRPLLNGAVLANDFEVLSADAIVSSPERLAVLPPVCGG